MELLIAQQRIIAMAELQDVVIVGAARTAIGSFGGALKEVAPSRLGTLVIGAALARAGLRPDQVEHVVMGQVIQTEPRDAYLARVCAMDAGVPARAPALTVNRLCGSGLQAIVSAAQMVRLGECDVVVAGGAETMSKAPYICKDARWGQKMGSVVMSDALLEALNDPFGNGHMGMTAERIADRYGISRQAQDAYALKTRNGPPRRSPRVASRTRSSRSRSQTARAFSCSTPTNMCAATPRRRVSPRCARLFARTAARSPPATPPASTTARQRWRSWR
jgi:hypothetical protein